MVDNITICHYCREPIKNPTKDHVYPKSKIKKLKSKDEPLPENVDIHNNVVLACETCNMMKGTKDYDSFMALGLIAIRHMKKMYNGKVIKNRRGRKRKHKKH